jgi:hypothetical protein
MRQAAYPIFLFLAFHLYLLCLTEAFVATHPELGIDVGESKVG